MLCVSAVSTVILIFTTLWAQPADESIIWRLLLFFFFQKIGLGILWVLLPREFAYNINLFFFFSRKNKKSISECRLLPLKSNRIKVDLYRSLDRISRRQTDDILLIFPENRLWHFMQIVSQGGEMREMTKYIFWENNKNVSRCRLLKRLPSPKR